MNAALSDRLLRLRDVVDRTNLCRAEIYVLIKKKQFPSMVKIGSSSRWSELELAAWIEEKKATRERGL